MSAITASACTSKPSLLERSSPRGRVARTPAFRATVPRRVIVRAEDPKQGEGSEKAKDPINKGGKAYIDELPVSRCYAGSAIQFVDGRETF